LGLVLQQDLRTLGVAETLGSRTLGVAETLGSRALGCNAGPQALGSPFADRPNTLES